MGISYHKAIDMWSLGCIIAELYTGTPIFPGENEQEQLGCIMEVMGIPDRHIIEKCSRRKLFFGNSFLIFEGFVVLMWYFCRFVGKSSHCSQFQRQKENTRHKIVVPGIEMPRCSVHRFY